MLISFVCPAGQPRFNSVVCQCRASVRLLRTSCASSSDRLRAAFANSLASSSCSVWRKARLCDAPHGHRKRATISSQPKACRGLSHFSTPSLQLVHSSMDNQVDHLSSLLKWRMDRCGTNDAQDALEQAVGELHHKMLANYRRWVRHVNVQRALPTDIDDTTPAVSLPLSALSGDAWELIGMWGFSSGADERKWVCNAQLHQLMLWYLIWGEAANLRHMPELLCFILYCASNALKISCSGTPWEVRLLYHFRTVPSNACHSLTFAVACSWQLSSRKSR